MNWWMSSGSIQMKKFSSHKFPNWNHKCEESLSSQTRISINLSEVILLLGKIWILRKLIVWCKRGTCTKTPSCYTSTRCKLSDELSSCDRIVLCMWRERVYVFCALTHEFDTAWARVECKWMEGERPTQQQTASSSGTNLLANIFSFDTYNLKYPILIYCKFNRSMKSSK